jgi:hypothetical protein
VSYSVSTLLTRNLDDVFGDNDPARRRAAIDEIFTEDCVGLRPVMNVDFGACEKTARFLHDGASSESLGSTASSGGAIRCTRKLTRSSQVMDITTTRFWREWNSPPTVEDPGKLHALTCSTESRSVYLALYQLFTGWRGEWDSNSHRFFRICKLQIPQCHGCRRCQRCRAHCTPLHASPAVSPDECQAITS